MRAYILLSALPFLAAATGPEPPDVTEIITSTTTIQVTAPVATSTSDMGCVPTGCYSNSSMVSPLETLRITSTMINSITTTVTPYNLTSTICNHTLSSMSESHAPQVSNATTSEASTPVITITKYPTVTSEMSITTADGASKASVASEAAGCSHNASTTVITITVTASLPSTPPPSFQNSTEIPPRHNLTASPFPPISSATSDLITSHIATVTPTPVQSQGTTSIHQNATATPLIPPFNGARSVKPHPLFGWLVILPRLVSGEAKAKKQQVPPQVTSDILPRLTLSSTETSTVTVFKTGNGTTNDTAVWMPCTTVTLTTSQVTHNFTTTVLSTITVTGQTNSTAYGFGTPTIHSHGSSTPTFNATSTTSTPIITGFNDAQSLKSYGKTSTHLAAVCGLFMLLGFGSGFAG